MRKYQQDSKTKNPKARDNDDISPSSDQEFSKELTRIIKGAEKIRLKHMGQLRNRHFIFLSALLGSVVLGGSAFAWAFLFEYNLNKGLFWLICSILLCAGIYMWSRQPLEIYRKQYKTKVMPALGKALGNLKFNPQRGISPRVLEMAGIIPPYKNYRTEDCFTGCYKGVKMILAEARLTDKNKAGTPVFDGVFVMLEIPDQPFKGRTVITSDPALKKQLHRKEGLHHSAMNDFGVFSSHSENIQSLTSEKLFQELKEISDLFDKTPLSVVFFAEKYLFMMIPCPQDLFEPSSVFVPLSTYDEIQRCKTEIQKILSIIDILGLYKK